MTTPIQRRHGMTDQAADAAVDQACRMLRLPTVRLQFNDIVEAVTREQMTYRAFLAELLLALNQASSATAPAIALPQPTPAADARTKWEPMLEFQP
jgi:hypothetical protein